MSPVLLSDSGLIESFQAEERSSPGTHVSRGLTGIPRPQGRIDPLPDGNPSVVGPGTIVDESKYPLVSGPLWRLPGIPTPSSRFRLLQQWEGTVSEVNGSDFVSVVRDLSDSRGPEEEVTMSLEEVPEPDLPLLHPGSIFYWSIGYRTVASGQTERVSTIRVRRLPAWSRSEIESVKREARAVKQALADMVEENGSITPTLEDSKKGEEYEPASPLESPADSQEADSSPTLFSRVFRRGT